MGCRLLPKCWLVDAGALLMKLAHRWFNWRCRGIFKTSPIVCEKASSVMVVTMLGANEIVMYLGAIKSFCLNLGEVPNITILDDGSLTQQNIDLLKEHIVGLTVTQIENVPQPVDVPDGGTWERLTLIAMLSKDYYVIQLDSDTLALQELFKIKEYTISNWSFTIPSIVPKVTPQLVQGTISRRGGIAINHGNSGFTGFAKGLVKINDVVDAARYIKQVAGEQLYEWG